MCLAVPMRLVALSDDGTGVAELDGARHTVDLALLESVAVGDYVIVHTGFAIERLDQQEADARLELFRQLGEAYRNQSEPSGESG